LRPHSVRQSNAPLNIFIPADLRAVISFQRGTTMGKLLIFLKEEDGVTAIEYALIASLIFLAIVSSVTLLSSNVTTLYNKVAAAF